MPFTAVVRRQITHEQVALLSRATPWTQEDADHWAASGDVELLLDDGSVLIPTPPPEPDFASQVQAYLDSLEAAREEAFRAVRARAMAALLANGWTEEAALTAGTEFVRDYSAAIAAYVRGDKPGLPAAVQADATREWLDLPALLVAGTIREMIVADLLAA